MIRLLAIGVISLAVFFPSYWLFHPIFGADIGAGAAAVFAFIVFPTIMLRLWKDYPPPGVVPIDPDDPFMSKMIRRSMGEFDRFKAGLAEARKEAMVKYPIISGSETTEHVWGLAHSIEGDSIIVSMVNEPYDELRSDDSINPRDRVPIESLEDWILMDKDGTIEGGYTHLALVKTYIDQFGKFPKKYRQEFGAFVDIDWSEIGIE